MRWRTGLMLPLLTALLVALLPDGRAAGQAPRDTLKLDAAAIDVMVSNTLREVILRGGPIYNAGDFESCYQLYYGALMATRPMLSHRAGLQKEIEKALGVADRTTELQKRAWVLREVMDLVRTEVRGKIEGPPTGGASLRGKVTLEGQP